MSATADATTLEALMARQAVRGPASWGDHLLALRLVLVMGTWIGYLVAGGVFWSRHPGLVVLAVLTVGGYLFSWLAYYRHELWHNYFRSLPNPPFYRLSSYLLFSDPQVYGLCHASHHKDVHTRRDLEFFCEDHDENPGRRRRQFWLEVIFGNMAWEVTTIFRLKRAGKLDVLKARMSLVVRVLVFGNIGLIAEFLRPGAGWCTIFVFFLTAWWGALITRHNQWIEHIGLRDDDASVHDRIMMTRALKDASPISWLFNFMNHNDPHEHVLHHLYPKVNSRSTGMPIPHEAPVTSLPEYGRHLIEHYRSL